MSAPSSLIHTFGCRLNQFDGDALARLLHEAGFARAQTSELAGVHIINSCTITHEAKQEAERFSRKLARQFPGAPIVWTGCAASSREGQALLALPNVALVLDNAHKADLPRRLAAHLGLAPRTETQGEDARDPLPVAPQARRSRALLKVQDGCDYRCSFCIVPEVRGKSRSIKTSTLLAQLDELLDANVPEVVVTGVHLGTWGREWRPRQHLVGLLETLLLRIEARGAPCRLRLSSIDPHEWTPQATALFTRFSRTLCRSLHLPTQSLCPATLKRMRRAHRAEHFEAATRHLTSAISGIAIGTDIIVGHPGETREHFEETLMRLARLPLSYLHVFGYSPRAGTAAIGFPNPVDATERKRRVAALRELSAQLHEQYVRRHLGEVAEVVVHRDRVRPGAPLVGMTDHFIKVRFEGPDAVLGGRVRVRLDGATPQGARGTLLEAVHVAHPVAVAPQGRARLQLTA